MTDSGLIMDTGTVFVEQLRLDPWIRIRLLTITLTSRDLGLSRARPAALECGPRVIAGTSDGSRQAENYHRWCPPPWP